MLLSNRINLSVLSHKVGVMQQNEWFPTANIRLPDRLFASSPSVQGSEGVQ